MGKVGGNCLHFLRFRASCLPDLAGFQSSVESLQNKLQQDPGSYNWPVLCVLGILLTVGLLPWQQILLTSFSPFKAFLLKEKKNKEVKIRQVFQFGMTLIFHLQNAE